MSIPFSLTVPDFAGPQALWLAGPQTIPSGGGAVALLPQAGNMPNFGSQLIIYNAGTQTPTLTISGTNENNNLVTENLTLPASNYVSSTKIYWKLTSITANGTCVLSGIKRSYYGVSYFKVNTLNTNTQFSIQTAQTTASGTSCQILGTMEKYKPLTPGAQDFFSMANLSTSGIGTSAIFYSGTASTTSPVATGFIYPLSLIKVVFSGPQIITFLQQGLT